MRGIYACVATRHGGQLPTFFLQEDIHGITSEEHAQRIAQSVVGPEATVYVALVEDGAPVRPGE